MTSESTGETAHLHRPVLAFAACICDRYLTHSILFYYMLRFASVQFTFLGIFADIGTSGGTRSFQTEHTTVSFKSQPIASSVCWNPPITTANTGSKTIGESLDFGPIKYRVSAWTYEHFTTKVSGFGRYTRYNEKAQNPKSVIIETVTSTHKMDYSVSRL